MFFFIYDKYDTNIRYELATRTLDEDASLAFSFQFVTPMAR